MPICGNKSVKDPDLIRPRYLTKEIFKMFGIYDPLRYFIIILHHCINKAHNLFMFCSIITSYTIFNILNV
jgi:hypothetical protein